MSRYCNGCGDCDECHNMHCREWIVCDICGERITDDKYISFGDNDYHTECFTEKYEVSQ